MTLCLCGCGQETKNNNKYIFNHNKRGKSYKGHPMSIENKEQLSQRMRDHNPMHNPDIAKKSANSNRGKPKHFTPKYIAWIKENQGKIICQCGCNQPLLLTKSNYYNRNNGNKYRSEHREKTNHHTKESILIIVEKNKLNGVYKRASKRMKENNPMFDPIQKENLSKRMKENNPNWKGGKSFEIYPQEFNRSLRKQIRNRDNNTCQECGGIFHNRKELHVHHIDYNKNNCDPDNLISLCNSCHIKTNTNRKKWTKKYQKIIQLKNEHKYKLQVTFN